MDTVITNWKKSLFTIWIGQTISQFSSPTLQFAVVWYLTDHIGSAMVLTAVMMIGLPPQGVLGPSIGVFIDRYNRERIMTISDLLISAASFIMVSAGWTGRLSIELILVVLLVRPVGSVFHNPCPQAVTPQIVPAGQLTRCAGYSQTLKSVSQTLSPIVAAVLYSSWSLSGIISLDVAGVLIAVVTLGTAQIPELQREGHDKNVQVSWEAKESLRILRAKKGMLGLVSIGSLYTLALTLTSALFPLTTISYFNGTSTSASIVEAVFSAGLLVGSLILSKWGGTKNRVYTIASSFLLMSFSLFVLGTLSSDGFCAFILCSWLMGVSGPFYWGMHTLLLQSNFEVRYLRRVLSLSSSIRLLSGPLGLTVSGIFAERYGVEDWFLIAGVLVLAAPVLCVAVSSVQTRNEAGTLINRKNQNNNPVFGGASVYDLCLAGLLPTGWCSDNFHIWKLSLLSQTH